jgi:hypothetical protein
VLYGVAGALNLADSVEYSQHVLLIGVILPLARVIFLASGQWQAHLRSENSRPKLNPRHSQPYRSHFAKNNQSMIQWMSIDNQIVYAQIDIVAIWLSYPQSITDRQSISYVIARSHLVLAYRLICLLYNPI